MSQRDVTVRINARLAGGNPFARLGQQADDATRAVNRRLDDIRRGLAQVSTAGGQLGRIFDKAIGAVHTDEAVGRIRNKLEDTLRRIDKQRVTFQMTGDPAPLLGSLRRVQIDVDKLKRTSEAAGEATLASFHRAAGGATELARGVAILTEGNQGFEQMVKTLLKLQAFLDVGRGLTSLFGGLAGGVKNLRSWGNAMSAGQAVEAQFAASTSRLSVETDKETVASHNAATGMMRQATAAEAASQSMNRLAESIRRVREEMQTANAQTGVAGGRLLTVAASGPRQLGYDGGPRTTPSGSGRPPVVPPVMTGTASGLRGTAAGVGTVAALTALSGGGARDIAGAGLSVVIGQVVSSVIGRLFGGLGAAGAAGAGGGLLGGLGGLGTAAGGAALAATPFVAGGLGIAATGAALLSDTKAGQRMIARATGNGMTRADAEKQLREEEQEKQLSGDELTLASARRRQLQNRLKGLGAQLPVFEERDATRLQVERPFRERRQALEDTQAALRFGLGVDRQSNRLHQFAYGEDQAKEKFDDALRQSVEDKARPGAMLDVVGRARALLGRESRTVGGDERLREQQAAREAQQAAQNRVRALEQQLARQQAQAQRAVAPGLRIQAAEQVQKTQTQLQEARQGAQTAQERLQEAFQPTRQDVGAAERTKALQDASREREAAQKRVSDLEAQLRKSKAEEAQQTARMRQALGRVPGAEKLTAPKSQKTKDIESRLEDARRDLGFAEDKRSTAAANAQRGVTGSEESEAALSKATQERQQALARVLDVQKQINAAQRDGSTTLTQQHDLQEQLAQANQKLLEADQKHLDATRANQRAELERVEKFRDYIHQAERFYQDEARHEQDKLKSMAQQYGLMDAMSRQAVLGVAEKLSKGQPLSKEELEIARGSDILKKPLEKLGEQNAANDPAFQRIVKLTGADQKLNEAQQAQKQLETIRIGLEQKVNAVIQLGEGSLAKEVNGVVVPAIQQAILNMRQEMQTALNKVLYEQTVTRQAQQRGS